MTRILVIALAALLAAPASVAWADEPPPTKEQLEAAKKAFQEGDALYRAGKLVEAIDKLKESYRLSRNAMLLYNIGHIADQAGKKEDALFYYRKFLANAPASAPKRGDAGTRIQELEKQGSTTAPEEATTPAKTTGKYSEADFKHEVVFTTPPHKPLEIKAVVPEDSGFALTLFYRGNNDVTFAKEPMTWANKELVATIPGDKLVGKWIQYYIEVRDGAGKLITRSGKSTSPNLVNFEGGETKTTEEDPLVMSQRVIEGRSEEPPRPPRPATFYVKWISTVVAVGSFGDAIAMFVLAKQQHDKLLADAVACGPPPCRQFDATFDQRVETLGSRYDLIYKLSLGVGIATAGVAGYLWYRDITKKPETSGVAGSAKATKWAVAPALGDHFVGAAMGARF